MCCIYASIFCIFFFFFNFTAVLCSAHSYSFFSLGLTSLSWAPQSEHIALLFFHKQITSFLYKISDTIFSQLFTCFVTIAFFVSVVYLPLPSIVTFVFLFIVLPYFFYAYCEFPGLVGQEGNSVYLYLSSLSYSQSIVRVTCWRHDKYDFWKLSLINYWKCKKTFPPSFMGFRVLLKLRKHWINLK